MAKKKYKVDLFAKLVGFREVEVEADSDLGARQAAYTLGQELADKEKGSVSEWDVQYVDYHNSSIRKRDGTVHVVYEVDINEVQEIP